MHTHSVRHVQSNIGVGWKVGTEISYSFFFFIQATDEVPVVNPGPSTEMPFTPDHVSEGMPWDSPTESPPRILVTPPDIFRTLPEVQANATDPWSGDVIFLQVIICLLMTTQLVKYIILQACETNKQELTKSYL